MDQLKEYWREFLLIPMTSTEAATCALQLLDGSVATVELLGRRKSNAQRHESKLIHPLIQHAPITIGDLSNNLDFFGDFYSLNKAFLSSDPCGIDNTMGDQFFKELGAVIDLLPSEQGEEISRKIFEAIRELFNELQNIADRNSESFIDPIQIRFILILSGFPLFDAFPTTSQVALSELHRFVSKLSPSLKSVLRTWYSYTPLSIFRRHVAMSQQLITLQILETMATDGLKGLVDRVAPTLRHALEFIKLLFEANLMRNERQCIDLSFAAHPPGPEALAMDVSEFYNDAINSTEGMTRTDFIQHQRTGHPCDFQLLENPFVLDASTKAWYLLQNSLLSQQIHGQGSLLRIFNSGFIIAPFLVLKVRRAEIVHDALRKLTATVSESDLKKTLKVVFDDEEGVDEGGVTKEFFQLLVEKLFNADYGMFEYYEDSRVFWFNGNSLESSLQFELIGVVLGLAIYNGVILDLHFPMCVYKKLLDVPVGINDLAEFKPAVANSLRRILQMSAEDLAAASLTFSVDVQCFGQTEEHPLGDHDIDEAVTTQNREEYVKLHVKWYLQDSIEPQFRAFYRGFIKCCGDEYLKKLFQPLELMLVICGSPDFDLASLESATIYQDGYDKDSQTVRDFWEIAHSLSEEDKKKLLFFVTGSDRVPIKGLSSLQFFIGRHGSETDRLPTAHTCFNYLLLPDYKDKEKMHRLLSLALEHHTGFGLR